jgi:hypothetical protein
MDYFGLPDASNVSDALVGPKGVKGPGESAIWVSSFTFLLRGDCQGAARRKNSAGEVKP